MKVYVVVVTYNAGPWITKCFGSLQASDFPLVTIVVDNGSTDDTVERLHLEHPEVELYSAERNLGFGQANNVAIRMAYDRGADHVFLLNQDAWIGPETIGLLLNAAASEVEYGILSPVHLNGEGNKLDHYFSRCIAPERCPGLVSDLYLGRVKDALYATTTVNAAAWLITRRCIEVVGGFNPSFFHYGEDDNYVARVHFHGFKIGILPSARIHHDREGRSEGFYFDDPVEYERRMFVLKLADPKDQRDAHQDVRKLKWRWWRSVLRMRWGYLPVIDRKIKAFAGSDLRAVIRNREVSRQKALSFLEGLPVVRAVDASSRAGKIMGRP